MLDSIPVPFQAIVWPLFGAVLILPLSRRLPNWARRLLAMVAALASLVVLWSLRGGPVVPVEITWQPLNFFRMSPVLYPDGLSLLVAILLAGLTAACVLGIQGMEARTNPWHSLVLIVLSGCLTMALAANLLALALGSALLDIAILTVILFAATGADSSKRVTLSLAVPGLLSTLTLLLAALQMDAQLGHASLLARTQSETTLVLIGVAGILRALVFPVHPRGLRTPEGAATVLLPAMVGLYLLVRVQALMPALSERSWMLAVAVIALLAGGFLSWSSSAGEASRQGRNALYGESWLGMLVHQTGYVFVFVLLLAGVTPWPLLSMALALAALVIWWDGTLEREKVPRPGWLEWSLQRINPWWMQARSHVMARLPALERWRQPWLGRYGPPFLATIALASLAGAPLTAGARGRWPFYAAWLKRGDPSLLISLAADTLFVAGLWLILGAIWERASEQRPRFTTVLALGALVFSLVLLGFAPGILNRGLDLKAADSANISVWGLGLVYVLPWLLGTWLARLRPRFTKVLGPIQEVMNLTWLYRAAGWAGERLAGVLHWLGRVGEGEGWWGWALVILALGVVLLLTR